jgi:hypothetical protein
MIKIISCPKCKQTITIEGNPGDIKAITCPNCGLEGNFTFPKLTEKSHIIEEKMARPLGITILAALQIIGTIILIFLLIVFPYIYGETINKFIDFPIVEFLIIYILIMIPISLLLAYGLLIGKEWARFSSVLFQISSVISSLISFNFFGVIIPIFIIYYLRETHVKKYFKTEKGIKTNIKAIIIAGVIILIILNSSIALMVNPLIIMHNLQNISNLRDKSFIGYWSNSEITIIFEDDYTLKATYDNETYSGNWHSTFFGAEINWFQELKLPHPNNSSYLYSIEEVFLINGGNKLSLYTPFDSPPYLTLNKIVSN